jgi:hypothetical protein
MGKKFAFIVLCSLCSCAVVAQEMTGWRLVSQLPGNISGVKADDLEGIYWFDQKFMLHKADTLGNTQYTYSDKRFNATSVIVSANPFRTYVLLPDYGEIIALDKRLLFQARLDLNQFGFVRVSAMAPSLDNRSVWIFDDMRREALSLDERLNVIKTTGPVSQYGNIPSSPTEMLERSGKLYLIFDQQGVAFFDDQGVFEQWIPLPGATSISCHENRILYINENRELEIYDPQLFTGYQVKIPENITHITTGKQYFLMRDDVGLWSVYTF